jgi:Zn-dependent protease with chaperone function
MSAPQRSLAPRAALALVLFVGFYALAITVGAALLYIAWGLGAEMRSALAAKLAFAAAAAGGTLLYSLRPRRDKFEPPGPRVTEQDQPALFAVIKDLSAGAQQPLPDEVFIVGDVNAWVANRGGTMGIGGERVMTLGLGLMQMLSVGELKAVIAHELGHFSGGDTKLGHIVYRTRSAIARTLEETSGRWVELPFRAYGALFMRTSMAVSRSQEFAADAFAARLTDPRLLASGLEKVQRAGPIFPFYRQIALSEVLSAGFRPPMAAGFQRFLDHPIAHAVSKHAQQAETTRSPYDSHPPTSQRLAALQALPMNTRPLDTAPAITLLKNLSALEAGVLATEGVEAPVRLTEIPWTEVTARVHVPSWREVITAHADALRDVQIDALPTSQNELVALGRKIQSARARLTEAEDLATVVTGAIAAAVALRLFEDGWSVTDAAGLHFTRNGVDVEPFVMVPEAIAGEDGARERWMETCRKAGLSGLLFRVPGS